MVERLRGESIKLFNDSGEEIQRTDLKLSNPNFGYIDKNGLLQVKWRKEDQRRVWKMHEKGRNPAEIAEDMELPLDTVSQWLAGPKPALS